jgi:Fe-S cluster assembly protein SufD
VHLGRPLVVQSISTAGRLVPVRHLMVLGEGAKATVIEHYVSAQAGTHFTNAVTECLMGAGARLTHVKLQDEHGQAFHTARIVARQGRGSHLNSLSLVAGGLLTRNDIVSHLTGESAHCLLNGLTLGAGRRHTDHHLFVDHSRPGGTSEQHYSGIAAGRSRIVFNGRIRVAPGASKTDARQLNRNLLLSRDAEIDSKPQLEIYNNDVKCSHGSATGGLDEGQLFYLRSRGLPGTQARAMLIEAFAVAVIDVVKDEKLKSSLRNWIIARLPELTGDE